jgi:hypothetical protein
MFEDEFANLANDEGGKGSSKRKRAITVSARLDVWVKGKPGLEDMFEDEFANLANDEGGMGSSKRNSAAC